jgi:OmcA/MtrC family decaheme c-type cytochrome
MLFRKPSPLAIRILALLVVVAASVALISAPRPLGKTSNKAAFADPNLVNFVRPGLVYKILSAQVAADGTVTARIRITDPRGLGLDRAGIKTPGSVSGSLILAYIPKGQTQYVAYTTRTQTSPITSKSAVQAGTDSGGTWTEVAEGEYIYKFGTKLPASYDKTATHTIGIYGNRNLTEFDLGVYLADATYNFVPDGSAVTVTRDVIKTASCNKCHDNLHLHGETGRKSMEVCVLCHQPQTIDPDTGNTQDMAVLIHKIHAGAQLPSVVAGGKYVIIGNQQSVHDYSHVEFPSDLRSCTSCHESGKGAAQQDAWLKPTRAACGACHDDVNFATGEGHVDLPQVSDNQCATCHVPQGELEFDASIKGAHTIPRDSTMLTGLQYELLKVENGSAGKNPTVTFSLKDKSGAPLAVNQMQRLALVLAGPTTDYSAFTTGYVSEDITTGQGVSGSGGIYTYTFKTAIPASAKGSYSIMIEGRREEKVLEGTKKEQTIRYGAPNKVIHFSVDGSAVQARRTVVSLAKCNACHTNLVLHGENRSTIESCVICHNPIENDKSRRPATAGAPETIDFRFMIHRIHGGAVVSEEHGTDYIVYGYGGSKNDFSHVGYPAPLNSCGMCHVNGSENLPLKAGLVPVQAPRQKIQSMNPETAACLACHQGTAAASHALANTTTLGESCSACHGASADFSVSKSHVSEVQ